ncbi:phospholipid carrier-dependent glycosyltransferase [Candidatus Parcubacteria bacterium]|nr:MAG: phospholipid carrier-dependent glycosyltransferase [Candidatus Parcubacteria bacterium]
MKIKFTELLLVPFLIFVFIALQINSIFSESRVYDENLHIDAGYTFLTKKDFRAEPFNPPLARELIAVPLLFNPDIKGDPILFWPRITTVLFSVFLAVLVYFFAKKAFGLKAGIFALVLYIFEPNILAHGHYATTDLILSFFIFLTIFLSWIWREKLNLVRIIIISSIVGLSLSVKFSALPFLSFSILGMFLIEKKKNIGQLLKFGYWKKRIKFVFAAAFFLSISLWSTYFFTVEPILGLRFDSNRETMKLAKNNPIINFALNQSVPLGSYISTIKQMGLYNYSDKFKKDAFLFGQFSDHGFAYYFPAAFIVKTPIPLLVLFIIGIANALRSFHIQKGLFTNSPRTSSLSSSTMAANAKLVSMYLLIPIAVVFLFMSFSQVNLGLRYVLPAFPFIIVFSSQIINLCQISKLRYLLISALLIWYIFGTIKTSPHFISYFNELVGGSQNGYKYLIDSNYDWGQGLIALKEYQDKNNIKSLELAYFGSISPQKYGIKYDRLEDKNLGEDKHTISVAGKESRVIAISATCWYYCGYYKTDEFKDLMPVDIVGGSILIFKK